MSAFIKTNFTDAALAFLDQTTMPAGETVQGIPGQMLSQLSCTFGGHFVEDFSE